MCVWWPPSHPTAVCLQTVPGAMDESELAADVTLIIICQAYQHLLASSCDFRPPFLKK